MSEVTMMLSAPTVLMLIFLVMLIVFRIKMWREERAYYRQQIERLVEENQQYHQFLLRMTDRWLANRAKSNAAETGGAAVS